MEDSCKFEFLDEKWEVKKDDLLKKISGLTNFQKAAVEMWATTLWQKHNGEKIDKFKKILL